MDNSASNSSTLESELYFLIARFLSAGPCKRTAQVLLEELEEFKLLQKRVDWEGNQHFRTYENLVYLNRHIRSDHLLKIVERICPLLDKEIKPSIRGVRSLLGAGTLSLLRTPEDLERPKWGLSQHLVRQNGAPPCPPSNLTPPNLALVMSAYQLTGVARPHSAVPSVLYNKMSLYGRKLGHLDAVYCVLFDRTGNYIFTAADDTLVKIWSRFDLRLLATLRGHSAEITDMALSYENTYLASVSLDKSVRIWCLRTKAQRAVLHAHSSMITSVQFCPKIFGDNRYLVTTGNDGCVCFWQYNCVTNFFNPKPIKFIEKSRAGAQMLCSSFSPGGAFLATGNSDQVVRVYFLHTIGPEKICELEAHNDKVDSICYANHQNSFLSGSNDGTARIWRYDRHEWRATVLNMSAKLKSDDGVNRSSMCNNKLRVTMVSWTMDDNRVITAASDLTIKIWDSHSGSLLKILEGHEDEVFVLETSPTDNRILVSAGHDGKILIWDIYSGAKIKKFFNLIEGQGHGAVFDCKFSPDGQFLAATDSHGHLLLMGIGGSERCKKTPQQLFFHTDYRPLIRDSKGFVLDEQTQCPPHLMPPPFLVDIDGNPYPPAMQRLVPGREHMKTSSLLPHIAVNEAGESEIVGDHDTSDDRPVEQNNSDTDVEGEESVQQPASVAGRGNVRASIDVMIEQLQRQQDQRLGQVMSPPGPSLSSPPPTPRANAQSRVGLRRSGEIEGVRQSHAAVLVNTSTDPSTSNTTTTTTTTINREPTDNSRGSMTVKPLDNVALRISEERRTAYSEEEVKKFIAERKKKLTSPTELTSASVANNKRRQQKVKKPVSNIHYLDDIPENVETARNRLTTRALYDTEEEEDEGGGSDVEMWQSDSSEDYSDWVGDQGSSNLEPPKRRSQRKRKRRYISSSEEEDEDESDDRIEEEEEEERISERQVNIEEDIDEDEAETEITSDESGDEDETKNEQGPSQSQKPRGGRKSKAKKESPKKKTKPIPDRNKEMDEKMKPPDWITTVIPRKAPFVPQMGDEVVYFRQGHEQYLHAVHRKQVYDVDLEKNQPWHKIPNLRAHEVVKIVGIKWLIKPTRLCCLKLAFLDTGTGKLTGKSFTIKYHDMPDVIDFLVLRQHYDISVQRGWKQGSKFRSMIDDQWWLGTVKSKQPLSPEFPDSLYQCLNVHWDNGEVEKLSPWDMEPINPKRKPSVVGGGVDVTPDEYKALLYVPKKTEWPSCGREAESQRLVCGINALMQHSFAEPFSIPVDLQQFPTYAYFVSYPIDLSTIKTRLENGFYRRVTALQWDVRLIHTNTIIFNQSGSKIIQMANAVTETLLKFIKDQECEDPLTVMAQLSHSETKGPSSEDDGHKSKDGLRKRKTSKKNANPNKWLEDSESLLGMLFECEDSNPFRLPVDPDSYPDYNDIVTCPMDLTTVHTKLATGHYGNPLEMCKDVRLIFFNSKLYNTNKRSRIYSMTLRLSALFEDQISPIIRLWKSARTNGRQGAGRSSRPSSSHSQSTWSSLTSESLLLSEPSTSGQSGPSGSGISQAATSSRTGSSTTGHHQGSSSQSSKNSKPKAAESCEEDDSDATILDDGENNGIHDDDEDDTEMEICNDGDPMIGLGVGSIGHNDDDDDGEDDGSETDDVDYKPGSKTKINGTAKASHGKGKMLKRSKGKSTVPLSLRPPKSSKVKKSIFYVSEGEENLLDEEDDIVIPPTLKFGKSKNGMVHSFEVGGSDEDVNDLSIKEKSLTSRKSIRRARGKVKPRRSVSPEVKKDVHRKARIVRRNVKMCELTDEEEEITMKGSSSGNPNSAFNRSSRRAIAKKPQYQDSETDESEQENVKNARVKIKQPSYRGNLVSESEGATCSDPDANEETEEETNSSLLNGSHSTPEKKSVRPKRRSIAKRKYSSSEGDLVSSPDNESKENSKRKRSVKRKISSSEGDSNNDAEDSDFGHQNNNKQLKGVKPSTKQGSKLSNPSSKKKRVMNSVRSSKKSKTAGDNAKMRTRNCGQQRVTYLEDSEEDVAVGGINTFEMSDTEFEEEESPVSQERSVSSRGRLRKMTTRARESLKAF